MTTEINAKVMASIYPKVGQYIKENMIGYMSTSLAVQDVNKDTQSKLYVMDNDSDVGTYQFYFNKQGSVVVSDYFDEDKVFGTYGLYEGTKFN
ncbi:hypothetical protein [Vibrio sp.]|uniref:hypothetical protein n=1 Tax=Vibrio sp. TaxID=678 RepID=UPI003AA93FD7